MRSTEDYYLLEELGQSFNETLITKLLTSTFNHSQDFSTAFMNVCQIHLEEIRKIHAVSEVAFTSRKNRIDIVLCVQNDEEVEIFIIENKLLADEGVEQATRYYEAVTNGLEIEKLKQKYGFEGINKFHFIYLTLLGDQPSNDNFLSITYEDILRALETGGVEDDTLSYKVLKNYLDYLHKEVQPYAHILNEMLCKKELHLYLKQLEIDTPFIKQIRKNYFDTILKELKGLNFAGYEFEPEFSSNSANGIKRVSWRKSNWLSPSDILQREAFSSNYRILLQSSFIPNNNMITIEIHYETQPYYSQSQIKTQINRGLISKQNEETYRVGREAFVDLFHEKCKGIVWPEGISLLRRNTVLTFAIIKVPIMVESKDNLKNDTFLSLAERIRDCSKIVSQTVEEIWAELL